MISESARAVVRGAALIAAAAGFAIPLQGAAAYAAASTGAEQIFRGRITSCHCGPGKSAAAACPAHCTGKGTTYMLADAAGSVTYRLTDQRMPALYPSQDVLVVGYLEHSSSIHVDDIVRSLPPQAGQAKTVAILCDACPRAMAKARRAALGAMVDWNHFTLTDDPRHADLIFLFSANPYLGDYLTRDGPDKRPVAVDTVYLNLIDPRTGANLWGDYRQQGWLLVPSSTRELITEVRQLLEMDQNPAAGRLFVDDHLKRRAPPDQIYSVGK
jgi:hypothetical protein